MFAGAAVNRLSKIPEFVNKFQQMGMGTEKCFFEKLSGEARNSEMTIYFDLNIFGNKYWCSLSFFQNFSIQIKSIF